MTRLHLRILSGPVAVERTLYRELGQRVPLVRPQAVMINPEEVQRPRLGGLWNVSST